MKKTITVMFALLLVANMMMVCFASNGSFVSSPSQNLAPELIKGANETPECVSELVVTSYVDRFDLNDEKKDELVAAYNAIVSAADLGDLSPEIESLAKSLGVSSSCLSVSDLFDISSSECDGHLKHGAFEITLKPTSTENFAAVLHYVDSKFEVIEGTVENGEITFVTGVLSPFALVVHDGSVQTQKANLTPFLFGGLFLLIVVILIIVLVISKKKITKKAG